MRGRVQDLKVRGAWVHFPVGVTSWIFLNFSRDSVKSTESIEFKANYGKTQLLKQSHLRTAVIKLVKQPRK